MVRKLNAPYFGKRYVGSSETKVLHDLDKETSKCRVESIPRNQIQMFEWLSVPLDMGYKGCPYCMSDYVEGRKLAP